MLIYLLTLVFHLRIVMFIVNNIIINIQSKKTYVFRAIQGDVKMWVKTIKSMMTFVKGEAQLVSMYSMNCLFIK